jgi:hypothetical protein
VPPRVLCILAASHSHAHSKRSFSQSVKHTNTHNKHQREKKKTYVHACIHTDIHAQTYHTKHRKHHTCVHSHTHTHTHTHAHHTRNKCSTGTLMCLHKFTLSESAHHPFTLFAKPSDPAARESRSPSRTRLLRCRLVRSLTWSTRTAACTSS